MESSGLLSMGGFPITRLNGSNYATWAQKVRLLLRKEALWDVVSNPPRLEDWDEEDDAENIARYQRDNERALCFIGLTLEDQQLVHIRGLESAKECWDTLKTIYVRDSAGAQIHLTRKLFRARLQPGGDMLSHLEYMKHTLYELQEQELIFTELQQAYIVLSSLDDSYDLFISTMEMLPRTEITMAGITSRLLDEARRRKDSALLRDSRQVSTRREKEKPAEDDPGQTAKAYTVKKCFNCGIAGHIAKKCKARKGRRSNATETHAGAAHLALTSMDSLDSDVWVVDSGASHSIAQRKETFAAFKPVSTQQVSLADGLCVQVIGEGSVYLPCLAKSLDMLCVPTLRYNLLSVSSLTKEGFKVSFEEDQCLIQGRDGVSATAVLQNGLFVLTHVTAQSVCDNIAPHDNCIHLLHRRLGHANFKALKRTVELSKGVKLKPCKTYLDCEACKEEKTKATPVKRGSEYETDDVLQVVFADLIGPLKPSLGGAKYVLEIEDHYSRYGFCYLLKSKDETYQHVANWIKFAERKTNKKVKCLITDNGLEFCNQRLQNLLAKAGIVHKRSAPYRPQHNSFVERRGQTLQAMARTMLTDSGLPNNFWGEAFMCANHLLNVLAHSSTGELPFTRWHGKQPDLSYLHVFGCPAWVYLPAQTRKKGGHRARKLYFLGYEANHKSYRFGTPGTAQVWNSASAKFLEQTGWEKLVHTPVPQYSLDFGVSEGGNVDPQPPTPLHRNKTAAKTRTESISTHHSPVLKEGETVKEEHSPIVSVPQVPVPLRQSTRERRPPDRYSPGITCQVSVEPRTYSEIQSMAPEDKRAWEAAVKSELDSLKKLHVYEDAVLPPGEHTIGCKWVFKLKKGIDGKTKCKARLVAQGFAQTSDDFDETFAPGLHAESLRIALLWAAKHKYVVNHCDIETAYLNADLRHVIYMQKPPGISNNTGKDCWLLKKSLYGLKQSGYEWNNCITNALFEMGFQAGLAEPCLFTRGNEQNKQIILLFTDDLAIITKTDQEATELIKRLEKKFSLRKLGRIRMYLGVQICETGRGYKLSQSQKIMQLLKKYNMEQCTPAKTPMGLEYHNDDSPSPLFDPDMYRSLIGSLSYIGNWTRPDICYSVNQLARHCAKPTQKHWLAAKRVLRYLRGTINQSLYLIPKGELKLSAFADASFATDLTTRQSTSGMVILLANAIIGWKSLRQKNVSVSSAESEYACLSYVTNELIWYKQLMQDLGVKVDTPITVYNDSQSAIAMANSPAVKSRSKHTDIRYHNVKENVKNGLIRLEYCESVNNLADHFTKVQNGTRHNEQCIMFGLYI